MALGITTAVFSFSILQMSVMAIFILHAVSGQPRKHTYFWVIYIVPCTSTYMVIIGIGIGIVREGRVEGHNVERRGEER